MRRRTVVLALAPLAGEEDADVAAADRAETEYPIARDPYPGRRRVRTTGWYLKLPMEMRLTISSIRSGSGWRALRRASTRAWWLMAREWARVVHFDRKAGEASIRDVRQTRWQRTPAEPKAGRHGRPAPVRLPRDVRQLAHQLWLRDQREAREDLRYARAELAACALEEDVDPVHVASMRALEQDSLVELRRTFPREEYLRVAAEKLGRSIAGN